MGYRAAIVVGLLFGAVDQYLGALWSTTHLGFWTISVSQMSAPWLLLPFLFGLRQDTARRAALVGLAATLAALAGYFAMTLSPLEGADTLATDPVAFISSQAHVLLPGLVSGPVFGWLGHRWRTERSALSAVLVAGAFCLEPLARVVYGSRLPGAAGVGVAEVALGLLLVVLLVRPVATRPR